MQRGIRIKSAGTAAVLCTAAGFGAPAIAGSATVGDGITVDYLVTLGYGLNVRTEDIARLGQLYLQRGRWMDRQLLPASWVDSATTRQSSNGSNPDSDWDQGYGFQFWRSRHGLKHIPT